MQNGLPCGLNEKQFDTIYEMFKDFLALLPRWKEVKKSEVLKQKFCSRNRNPLFDISSFSFFKTKLTSEEGLQSDSPVYDHFIQRTKAVELIFNRLEKNPQMDIFEFINLLKRFCSVVKISKEEHTKITQYCKKNKTLFNYEAYEVFGIRIKGLSQMLIGG